MNNDEIFEINEWEERETRIEKSHDLVSKAASDCSNYFYYSTTTASSRLTTVVINELLQFSVFYNIFLIVYICSLL